MIQFRIHSCALHRSIVALSVLAATAQLHAASIGHNAVTPFKQDVHDFQQHFQPRLKVEHGCVPFPAVDAAGNTGGGLKPTGATNGNCSKSTGQVYVRTQRYNGECATMYAWYFPKDQPSDGASNGHRHDWESVVVWTADCKVGARVNAVSYSGHGGFTKSTNPNLEQGHAHPLVSYASRWPVNHSLFATSALGGYQPAIDWGRLTTAARNALTNTGWGSANVPIIDRNFSNNLGKAWYR